MALNLGLTRAQLADLYNILGGSHWLRIQISVMDLNHNYLGDLSSSLLTGAVTIDTNSEITRSLQLQLQDLSRSIQLAPDDPDEGAAYPTRMIQILYCVAAPFNRRWYSIPIFTGPVTKAERDGAVLNVTCMGKEYLASSSLWVARTYKKGWNKGQLIRNIMSEIAGETRFDFDVVKSVTGKQTVMQRGARSPWQWAKSLSASLGMQIFYDGRGYLRMRRRPQTPVWSFTDLWMSEDPQVSFDLDGFWNCVEVTGFVPKGKKTPITVRVVAPSTHPLSPSSLGRNGVPRYVSKVEANSDLKTTAACRERANDLLQEGLLQGVNATFPSKPVPFLEEKDLIEVAPSDFSTNVVLSQTTIPLLAGEYMSVGYAKAVRPSRLAKRLRRV